MQKFQSTAIRGLQLHNQRERESKTNPDIDKEKTGLNYDLVNSESIDYIQTVNEKIEEGVESNRKIRKDAVRLCEFLVTSDNELFDSLSEDDEKKFFDTALDFIKDKYGAENIIYGTVHRDEKTPHMHIGFVPITEDKRLSAKDLFKKPDLVKLQDDFNKHMNESGFELERGVSSDRKHFDTAKYKATTLESSIHQLDEKKDKLTDEVKAKNIEALSKDRELHSKNKEIENKSRELEEKIADLERFKEEIKKVEVPLNDINSIEYKEKMFGNVSVKKEDFKKVMTLAKQTLNQDKEKIEIQRENKELKETLGNYQKQQQHKSKMFDKYFEENVQLRRKNKKLTQERNKFQKLYNFAVDLLKKANVYDKVKHLFEVKEKEIAREEKQHEEIER